jgi:hypothetical protein
MSLILNVHITYQCTVLISESKNEAELTEMKRELQHTVANLGSNCIVSQCSTANLHQFPAFE